MKKSFWKSYFNIFKYMFYSNGKIKAILIFVNPIMIYIMFLTYINIKKRYDYGD